MSWSQTLVWSAANRYLFKLSLFSVIILIADQITKQLALRYLNTFGKVNVLGEFLQFTLVFNEGGAFSTRLGSSTFYTIASILVLIFVVTFLYRDAGKNRLLDYSLASVIGGAIGNLIDRFRFGSVIDWIDVDFFDIHLNSGKVLFFDFPGYHLTRWPVFNIADSAVSVGMVMIAIVLVIESRRRKHESENIDSPVTDTTTSS